MGITYSQHCPDPERKPPSAKAFFLGLLVAALITGAAAAVTNASTQAKVGCHQTGQHKILVTVTQYACPIGGHASSAVIKWSTDHLSLINLHLVCDGHDRDLLDLKGAGKSSYVVNKSTHYDLYSVMRVSKSCTFHLTITATRAVVPSVSKT